MNIPKLDFKNLDGVKDPKARDFNIINGQQSARSNGTTVSWGTHAGSVYHNQCKQIYYRPKENKNEAVKIVKNKSTKPGDYVMVDETGQNRQEKTQKSESPINPPRLDLAEIENDCKLQTQPEIIKITIQPKSLQLIDHVADRHIQYLKTIKLDEKFLNRLDARLTARDDLEASERQRVIRDALDIILADQLSTGVLSSSKCTTVRSGTNGFIPGAKMPSRPIAKGASRRLHDTQVNPSGMVGENVLKDREGERDEAFIIHLAVIHNSHSCQRKL